MAFTVSTSSSSSANSDIPKIISDSTSKKEYTRGRFLGKGAFAKCYEVLEKDTNATYAVKIVSKTLLANPANQAKLDEEIQIHRDMNHTNIVRFHNYFEDEMNVYMVLELCSSRSVKEMQRRRETFTEAEARYFLRQVLLACEYLVQQRIVHRDLKLGNLLLNEKMELKVADFGLATRINEKGERKKTFCGTPNYLAPEVLLKKGHSFEVDVWAMGCILYTMLVGRPPFLADTVEATYDLIRKNRYSIPVTLSSAARTLIRRMLNSKPQNRPSISAILEDNFMICGPMPSRLPTSCLATPPRLDTLNSITIGRRRPLQEKNERETLASVTPVKKHLEEMVISTDSPVSQPASRPQEAEVPARVAETFSPAQQAGRFEEHLQVLKRLLLQLFSMRPPERDFDHPEEVEEPAYMPVFWVSKWLDFREKYGIGYQLCDSSIGILFNDNTRLIMLNNDVSTTYVDENGTETYHTLNEYPSSLEKKSTLLKHLKDYMKENLYPMGKDVSPRECDNLARLPYLEKCLRTHMAICFYLTNGTVQVNFLKDHTKLILCPLMAAVTYVDTSGVFHTYRLKTLQSGSPLKLLSRLQYARTYIDHMIVLPC